MGGCTDCGLKGGCDSRKAEERELLAELLPTLYPGRRWGEPDDAASFGRGVSAREGRRLARQSAEALKARAYFRPGNPEESCDYIYVLCVGREPGLFELRDAESADLPDGESLRDVYLRVALSSRARVAALQEVSFELAREGDLYLIREVPRAGVFDPILLKRTQRIVELLVSADLTYLDFGLIDRPPDGFDPGEYPQEYGQAPGIVNYLFYPQPATAVTTSFVPCAVPSHYC